MAHGKGRRQKSSELMWRAFAQAYIINFNARAAAISAGYSERTARTQGSNLLAKPAVQALIAEELEKRTQRVQVDADWVLQRLIQEAEADLADIYTESGAVKPIHEWPKIWRQGLMMGIDTEQKTTQDELQEVVTIVKLKQSDRLKRIELIGKHTNINAFKEVIEVQSNDLASLLTEANERAASMRSKLGLKG